MTGASQGGTEVIPTRIMGLRSRSKTDEEEVADAALISAEEKMLEDEEISSIDGFGNPVADTVKIENRNLTVAFARSVVETSGNIGDDGEPLDDDSGGQCRYGLRTTQKSDSATRDELGTGDDSASSIIDEKHVAGATSQLVKLEPGGSAPLPTLAPQPVASPPPLKAVPLVKPTPLPPRPPRLPAPALAKPLRAAPIQTSSHGVPNPLANLATPIKEEPRVSRSAATVAPKAGVRAYQSSVPCPLPAVFSPLPAPAAPKQRKIQPAPPLVRAVSIPVATAVATVSMDLIPTRRGRIFSMDIDAAGLDFPDMSVDNIGSGFCPSPALPPLAPMGSKQPHHLASSSNGIHSHSHGLPHPGGPLRAAPVPLHAPSDSMMGRGRAMSFEFFSLGINADEPLPPAPDMAVSNLGRPRGDSIIFDPASFQDGGIHEEKAFFRSRTNSIDLPSKDEMAIMNTPGFVSPPMTSVSHVPVHKPMAPASFRPQGVPSHPKHQQNAAQMATLPSSLNTTMNHATFQMDLLNKDGRIGIYLPDARKARIAKFHSKRKMRIWRKRIKYDCRKKLADSRPRIKGRFVKRSDMDEDP